MAFGVHDKARVASFQSSDRIVAGRPGGVAPLVGNGQGLPRDAFRPDLLRSGPDDTGLPVQSYDPAGSVRHPDLRSDEEKLMAAYSSVRDAALPSSAESEQYRLDGAPASDSGGLRSDDDGNRPDSQGRGSHLLSAFGKIKTTELPHVPNRHWEAPSEGPSENSGEGVRDGDEILADILDDAAKLALKRAIEVLQISIEDPDLELRNQNARVVMAAVQVVLANKQKADEGSFRMRLVDRMPDILEKINLHRSKVPPLMIEGQALPSTDALR